MPQPSAGWVLYDKSCGVCRRWVPFWAPVLARRGLATAGLQDAWVREAIGAESEQVLLRDLRVLLRDGQIVCGADAYRYVMRRIWWALPLYVCSVLPIARHLFDWGYRTFATHRHRVSRSCGLDGPGT